MANELATTETKGITKAQWDLIGATTPKDKIKTRPGRGGKQFSYVEAGYIVDLLNRTFNGLWDFEIEDQGVGKDQVWVRGRLTVYPTPEIKVTKTQYGGSDIKKTQAGDIVDIADDLKAAGSDCLKKCASLFGFAADIYWQEKEVSATPTITQSASESVGIGKASTKQVNYINVMLSKAGMDREEYKKTLGIKSMNDLTPAQASDAIKELQNQTSF